MISRRLKGKINKNRNVSVQTVPPLTVEGDVLQAPRRVIRTSVYNSSDYLSLRLQVMDFVMNHKCRHLLSPSPYSLTSLQVAPRWHTLPSSPRLRRPRGEVTRI
jgi:hypothetical protein